MKRVALLLLLGLGVLLALFFLPRAGTAEKVTVEFEEGASRMEVAQRLYRAGAVGNPYHFWLIATLGRHQLVAGEYEVSASEGAEGILAKLKEGRVKMHRVTFPEGWTARQMAKRLEAKGLVLADDFLAEAMEPSLDPDPFPWLPAGMPLEGFLFPDTYFFAKNFSAREIAGIMLRRFAEMLPDDAVERAGALGLSLGEAVIVASMVEAEARLDRERPVIAGVIYNRLRRKMPLQIDATVQYALPQRKARLTYADLKVNSPYNTYRHRGLPPGPIGNPGLASLKAALHPARHDFLYYVARPDGSHYFSRTYEEHLRYKARAKRERAKDERL